MVLLVVGLKRAVVVESAATCNTFFTALWPIAFFFASIATLWQTLQENMISILETTLERGVWM